MKVSKPNISLIQSEIRSKLKSGSLGFFVEKRNDVLKKGLFFTLISIATTHSIDGIPEKNKTAADKFADLSLYSEVC